MAPVGRILLQHGVSSFPPDVAVQGGFGHDPPAMCTFNTKDARSPAVHNQLFDWDEFVMEIRERLEQAQQCYKLFYDRQHRDVVYEPGQWVWLHLLHRPITSLSLASKGKLGPKFFGPFQVLDHVGEVAYRLQLSLGAKLRDVFHVGLLKKYCGEAPSVLGILPSIQHGCACLKPSVVSKSRLAHGRHELLVQWKGLMVANATWVILDEFRQTYPSLQLEDELIV
jgi:hypothetical protein